MSENSVESVSSRLEKHRQEKLLNEQTLSSEIESRLNDGFNAFNNVLVNIIAQLEKLPETLSLHLVSEAQTMANQHIETANQNLVATKKQVEQIQQDLTSLIEQLSQVGVQVEQQITGLKQTLLDSQTQSQTMIADYAQNLQQQAKTSMAESEKQYQLFYQDLSKKQATMRTKAILTGIVTLFLAMIPTAGMVGMAYYSKHLMTNQNLELAQVQQAVKDGEQQLATITSKVQQTPIEARALSMVTVLPNEQNPPQVLIIPKNQPQIKYGLNSSNQWVLQVAPEMTINNPPRK